MKIIEALYPVETETPLIPEDIEVGDRLYCTRYAFTVFGTVVKASPLQVAVKLDTGGLVNIISADRQMVIKQLAEFGKPLPLDQVEVGSRVSIWDNNDYDEKERFYGTVIEYVPERYLSIEYDDLPGMDAEIATYYGDSENGSSLEDVVKYWELEA